MFKKYNYFQNFPALNFAITYSAIIFTAAVYIFLIDKQNREQKYL